MIKPLILNKKELLRRITDKIDAQYHPQKIILFGSYAWGNPAKDSDIDLLIVKETNERHRERSLKVRRIIGEENGLVGIDILVYTPQEIAYRLNIGDSFISKIVKKGRLLYG